jgi:hypothetical protein
MAPRPKVDYFRAFTENTSDGYRRQFKAYAKGDVVGTITIHEPWNGPSTVLDLRQTDPTLPSRWLRERLYREANEYLAKRAKPSLGRKRAFTPPPPKGTCPVYTFELNDHSGSFEIIARDGTGMKAGVIKVDEVESTIEGGYIPLVSWSHTELGHRRCGLGTKLYERAAQAACKLFQEPLHSDLTRSGMSDGFWQKQVKKGRAICVLKGDPPASYRLETDTIKDRSSCIQYRLKTCAVTVLDGARGRSSRASTPRRARRSR